MKAFETIGVVGAGVMGAEISLVFALADGGVKRRFWNGERFLPRPLLRKLVAAGYHGRKTKCDWHCYDNGGKRLP